MRLKIAACYAGIGLNTL